MIHWRKELLLAVVVAMTLCFTLGCDDGGDGDADADADGDAIGDGDGDVDSDVDGDSDSDGDADGDADGDLESDAVGDADVIMDADTDAETHDADIVEVCDPPCDESLCQTCADGECVTLCGEDEYCDLGLCWLETDCRLAHDRMYRECDLGYYASTREEAIERCERVGGPTWECTAACFTTSFTDCESAEECLEGCATCEIAHEVMYDECDLTFDGGTREESIESCETMGDIFWDCMMGCFTSRFDDCDGAGACLHRCYDDHTYTCDCTCWCRDVTRCMIPGHIRGGGLGDPPDCRSLCGESDLCSDCGGVYIVEGSCS